MAARIRREVPSRETGLMPMPEVFREADLLDAHLVLQELDELLAVVGFGGPFDAGVDVFRVLAVDHHVDLLGVFQRAGHALEVAHRAHALVEVELLAQGDVERADAAADRGGHRALDGDRVFLQRVEGLLGQPDVAAVELGGFLAGIDFHPVDLLLAAVGLGHRGVDHLDHHRGDVHADAVAFDVGDDRIVRHWLAGDDFGTALGNLDQ
jgi:hypothetical protein